MSSPGSLGTAPKGQLRKSGARCLTESSCFRVLNFHLMLLGTSESQHLRCARFGHIYFRISTSTRSPGLWNVTKPHAVSASVMGDGSSVWKVRWLFILSLFLIVINSFMINEHHFVQYICCVLYLIACWLDHPYLTVCVRFVYLASFDEHTSSTQPYGYACTPYGLPSSGYANRPSSMPSEGVVSPAEV